MQVERPRPPPPLALALAVWGLAAALYLTGFFHRVAPAVLTGELMAGFGLSAAALGNLSAFYYYSYVPFQIPFGALADRFGPRKVLTGGAVLTSLGAIAFAAAPTYGVAGTGRFLIGYAYAKESAPAALAGTTTGIINTGNMLGGMLMQPAVGWILDRWWDGTVEAGVRIYSFDAYRAGFTLMLAWLAVSLAVVGFTRETNCRQLR